MLRSRRFRGVASFEEQVSAASPEFDAMMEAARDRFGRSMAGSLRDVLDLDRCGVEISSVNESSFSGESS